MLLSSNVDQRVPHSSSKRGDGNSDDTVRRVPVRRAVLFHWCWGNLGQLFYGIALLVSSEPVLQITRSAGLKAAAGLAALLLIKLILKKRRQADNRVDD